MTASAAPSATDIAVWFMKHAENNGWLLEPEKLQHLLFLSQVHFCLLNNNAILMPAAFVCDKNGFTEPNIARISSVCHWQALTPEIDKETRNFLEIIWKKYSPMSIRALSELIKSSPAYASAYQAGQASLINIQQIATLFKSGLGKRPTAPLPEKKGHQEKKAPSRKILISQNGPVVVSQWQPRKLSNTKSKETLNA